LSADPAVKALTVRLDEKDPYNQGLSNYLAGKAVQL